MMKSHQKAFAFLAITAALLTACDRAEPTSDVDVKPAYSNGQGNSNGQSKRMNQLVRTLAPAEGAMVMEMITPSGGTLSVGGHTLEVPKKAVSSPTYFIMKVIPGDFIHVELYAYDKNDWSPVERFKVPVRLTLSYANGNVTEEDRPRIAYLVTGDPNGPMELISGAYLPENKTVSALLPHFSGYAMAID